MADLALYRNAGRAAMSGRDFVLPDDVKALVHTTLSHRVILGPAAVLRRTSMQTRSCRMSWAKFVVPGGRSERLGQYEHVTAGDNYPAGVEFDSRVTTGEKLYYRFKLSLGFLVAWELDLVPLFISGF